MNSFALKWERIDEYDELASTQDVALERIRAGAARPGDVVVARRQTAGRGRRGRRWIGAEGALHMTAILAVPSVGLEWAGVAAALATAQGLRTLGVPAGVKWPNDVVIGSGKAAGVLVEVPGRGLAAVGIGVNVEACPVGVGAAIGQPACVADHSPEPVSHAAVLRAVQLGLEEIWPIFLAGDSTRLQERWRDLDTTPGKAVVLERDGQHGVAEGLDPSGALRVRTADGETTLVQIDEATFAS